MIKRYRRTAVSQYFLTGLVLIALVAIGYLSMVTMRLIDFTDQFVVPWAAGRAWLLNGINPYDPSVITLAENTLTNSTYLGAMPQLTILIEPAINFIFYLPFSLMPYEISRAFWVTSIIVIIGLIGYFSLQLSGWKITIIEKISIILMTIIWFPGVNAVLKGQISPFIILLTIIGIYLILQEKDTKAGFVLALTFGSLPTTGLVLFLLIIWSLSRKRWSILKAYFSGVAFLIIITLLLLPTWVLDWLKTVFGGYGSWDWIQTPLMDLSTVLPGVSNYLSIFLHGMIAIILFVLWITLLGKKGRVFTWKVLVMLVIAYLFHVTASFRQLFLVFPAMFMVFRFWSERWGVYGRVFSWLILILLVVSSWWFVTPVISFTMDLSNPLLTIGLPIFVFISMMWVRWWALEIPNLPFEGR